MKQLKKEIRVVAALVGILNIFSVGGVSNSGTPNDAPSCPVIG